MILAGIDIGTNTIRLLVADISASSHGEIHSSRTITRLGQGLDRTGRLAPEAQERSFRALEEFAGIIGRHAVVRTAAVGTSALRYASNAGEFIAGARQRSGLDITVISGEEEAGLTLLGVRRALAPSRRTDAVPLASALVIDIGGGSTELISTRQGDIESVRSLPLGAVYLTERFVRHDPPAAGELEDLRSAISRQLDALPAGALVPGVMQVCAGTAGTITTLAAMDQGLSVYEPARINGYILQKAALDRMICMLASATLEDRKQIAGLERGREDIILAGALILQDIMLRIGAAELLVSDWGLREGILFNLYGKLTGTPG